MLANRVMVFAIVTATCLALSACVNSTAAINSNKLATYRGDVRKLLVVADHGDIAKYMKGGDDLIKETMESTLNACGVITEYHSKNPIAVINETAAWSATFRPEAILEIQWKSERTVGVVVAGGEYMVSLYDLQSKTTPWKATMTFSTAGYAAQTFVGTLVGQMKADGVINEKCVPPALTKR